MRRNSSPPSNVWRICRLFKKVGSDGASQIIYYHAGVGSSGSKLDSLTGGDFGVGLDLVCHIWASSLRDGLIPQKQRPTNDPFCYRIFASSIISFA